MSSDIAEKVLGHATRSVVEQTYDRFDYLDAKADALNRLAALIDGIVNPRDNVIPLARESRS